MIFATHCIPVVRFAAVFLLLATLMTPQAVIAQEAGAEHTALARSTMKVTGASIRLDRILPEVAAFTKAGLIANRPDIEAEISSIVDEVAISLAKRRGPLEDEVAAIYTQLFTLEELIKIEAFFKSEPGQKFLTMTPELFQAINEASRIWRAGITRDMSKMVEAELVKDDLQ